MKIMVQITDLDPECQLAERLRKERKRPGGIGDRLAMCVTTSELMRELTRPAKRDEP